jgi:hypothetical protein
MSVHNRQSVLMFNDRALQSGIENFTAKPCVVAETQDFVDAPLAEQLPGAAHADELVDAGYALTVSGIQADADAVHDRVAPQRQNGVGAQKG